MSLDLPGRARTRHCSAVGAGLLGSHIFGTLPAVHPSWNRMAGISAHPLSADRGGVVPGGRRDPRCGDTLFAAGRERRAQYLHSPRWHQRPSVRCVPDRITLGSRLVEGQLVVACNRRPAGHTCASGHPQHWSWSSSSGNGLGFHGDRRHLVRSARVGAWHFLPGARPGRFGHVDGIPLQCCARHAAGQCVCHIDRAYQRNRSTNRSEDRPSSICRLDGSSLGGLFLTLHISRDRPVVDGSRRSSARIEMRGQAAFDRSDSPQ